MRNRGVAIAMAMAAAMAGMPGAQIVPAGQMVANAGASQAGEQGQQNRLPGTANFLGALLDGAGGFGSKPFRPTYRKRPHGSVARDKRDSRKSRNRLRMKGRP